MEEKKKTMNERLRDLRDKGAKYFNPPSKYFGEKRRLAPGRECTVCEEKLNPTQIHSCSHKCAIIFERCAKVERADKFKWKKRCKQAELTIAKLQLQLKNGKKIKTLGATTKL